MKDQIQNSESITIIIFYNADEKPDLAKVTEDHYTQDEILSSSFSYINLPESIEKTDKITYTKPFLKKMIKYIFEEIK